MHIVSLQEVRDYYKNNSDIIQLLETFPVERIGDPTIKIMALASRQSIEILREELNRLLHMVDETPPTENTAA